MKKILFLFLLTFSIQTLKAQCTNYGYYVDATGFICNEDIGTICILTSADWSCDDGPYEVQITFPTGSFIYTDLGDFSVLGDIGVNTTIHATLDPISEGTTSYCLEGVIQVPGTTFAAQIVSINDPTIILNPTTFTLDVANIIGSNVGIPTISEAILQNLVLDPSTASFQGQRVIIDGNLQITEDYKFGGVYYGSITNEIKMKPGSSIEVMGGITFETMRSNISACDGNWDRIKVNEKGTFNCGTTNIRDASVAIELLNFATLNFFNSRLSNNDIGIGSFGSTLKTIGLNFFSLAFGIGNSITDGIDGCHFENVAPLTIGRVVFRNMTNTGIFLDKTDLTVANTWFKKCNYGIHVPTQNNLLSVNDCNFEDGYVGILSSGSLEMQITDNDFIKWEYAIARGTVVPNDHTLIEDNFFDFDCSYDIIGFIQPSRAEIQNNELYADRTNVGILGLGTGGHKWATQYNENMVAGLSNNNGYNVTLWNTTDARVFHNTSPYSTNYNFHVYGGSKNKIGYNTDCTSDNKNIQSIGSPNGTIYCNSMDGINGITILNDCAGSDIRGNQISGSSYNLVYGSAANTYANTGKQFYKGNIFDPSTEENPKAINFSNDQIAEDNPYLAGWYAGLQGTELYPYFISNFDNWFNKDEEGEDYTCPPMIVVENPEEKELANAIDANIRLLNARVEQLYGEEIAFDVQLKLYRDLTALNNITALNAEQQTWLQLLSGSNASKFVGFENIYQSSIQLSEPEEANLKSLSQQIKNLTAQINTLNRYSYSPSTELWTINQADQAAFKSLVSERDQAIQTISQILSPKYQELIAALPTMQSYLDLITNTDLQSVQNLKSANSYLLSRLHPTFSGFSETELQGLKSIADQCVGYGGEGVLLARVLLAESTLQLPEYNDECITAVQAQPRGTTQILHHQSGSLVISPNPAGEMITINLPDSDNERMLTITNTYGKLVSYTVIPSGSSAVQLPTSALPTGLYIVKVDGINSTAKLIISR